LESNHDIALNGIHKKSTTGFANQNFQNDNNSSRDGLDIQTEQF
jgi:hypothetical protein